MVLVRIRNSKIERLKVAYTVDRAAFHRGFCLKVEAIEIKYPC